MPREKKDPRDPNGGGPATPGAPPPAEKYPPDFCCNVCRRNFPWDEAPGHLHGCAPLALASLDFREANGEPAFVGIPRVATCTDCGDRYPALFGILHRPTDCRAYPPMTPAMEQWARAMERAAERAERDGFCDRPHIPTPFWRLPADDPTP